MVRSRLALITLLLSALGGTACSDKPAAHAPDTASAEPPAAAVQPSSAPVPAPPLTEAPASTPAASHLPEQLPAPVIHATLVSGGPAYSFTLIGERNPALADTLQVQRIEIRRAGTPEPVQRIDGLDTTTPSSAEAPGLEVLDMNFDGHADIRLIESRPAGPNTPYLNWLYDPASGRFEASPALNDISAPRFDAAHREIHTDWRDGANRYGSDVYVYRNDKPVLVRREIKLYKRPGVYTLQVSRWVNGQWKRVEQREVQEVER